VVSLSSPIRRFSAGPLDGATAQSSATLHRRASEWYEQQDLPSHAIRHALAAEDFERAADLAELAWPAWSGSIQSVAWFSWVKDLPDELVRARPVPSVAYAQAYLIAGKLEAAEARLLDAERWLEPTADMRPPLASTTTNIVFVDEEQFRILLGFAYWASGDLAAAHRTFSESLAGNLFAKIHGAFILVDIKMTLGDIHEAVSICEQAMQLAAEQGEPTPLATGEVYTALAELHQTMFSDCWQHSPLTNRSKLFHRKVKLKNLY
jgi:LuxR family maltose regulon positive regulatory protein